MISVQWTNKGEVLARVDALPQRLRTVLRSKFEVIMREVYEKAVGNLSNGKYTTTDEVVYGVEEIGGLLVGFIEPVTIKAQVQEFGGEKYYNIDPVKARLLRFIGARDGKFVFAPHVFHPPAVGKHYIENAIESSVADITEQLESALEEI